MLIRQGYRERMQTMTPRERGEWFMQQQQELTTALTKEWVGHRCWAVGAGARVLRAQRCFAVTEEGLLM